MTAETGRNVTMLAKDLAMTGYRVVTSRRADELRRHYDATSGWPAGVFFYHRVADTGTTPWSITNAMFVEQIDLLQKVSRVVSLDEVLSGNESDHRDDYQTAITFDDGYAETLEHAIPLLVERQLPCTYFVSTYFAETGLPFPHDVEQGTHYRPNTKEQVIEIANQGVEIGCHTEKHIDLGLDWSRERLRTEIIDTRHKLQDWTGQEIAHFSFPYGLAQNMSREAVDIVRDAGFRSFVSAYGAWNWPGTPGQHIRRIHADNRMAPFLNWLMLAPRKMIQEEASWLDC